MKKMMIFVVLLSLVLAGCSKSAPQGGASAATTGNDLVAPPGYPSGPITIIIPQNPGGATDLGSRIMAKYAQEYFSKPVVAINMAGGGAAIGLLEMLKKPADGHTISTIFVTAYTTSLTSKQFDMKTDFDYICQQVSDPRVLSFNPKDKRFSTREELFQYAKSHPDELTMAATNLNTDQYFQAITLSETTDLKAEVVAFDGFGPTKTAFLGEFVDILFVSLAETTPMLAEKQVVPICIFTEDRYENELPGVPTGKEIGIDLVSVSNRGYAFKKGTDKAIRDYVGKVFERVVNDPRYIEEMTNLGLISDYKPADIYAKFIGEQVDYMSAMLKKAKLID